MFTCMKAAPLPQSEPALTASTGRFGSFTAGYLEPAPWAAALFSLFLFLRFNPPTWPCRTLWHLFATIAIADLGSNQGPY